MGYMTLGALCLVKICYRSHTHKLSTNYIVGRLSSLFSLILPYLTKCVYCRYIPRYVAPTENILQKNEQEFLLGTSVITNAEAEL